MIKSIRLLGSLFLLFILVTNLTYGQMQTKSAFTKWLSDLDWTPYWTLFSSKSDDIIWMAYHNTDYYSANYTIKVTESGLIKHCL